MDFSRNYPLYTMVYIIFKHDEMSILLFIHRYMLVDQFMRELITSLYVTHIMVHSNSLINNHVH